MIIKKVIIAISAILLLLTSPYFLFAKENIPDNISKNSIEITDSSPHTRPPMAIRVESVPPLILQTHSIDGTSLKDWLAASTGIIGVLGTIVVASLGYWMNRKTIDLSISNNDKSLWQKANEVELKSIQERLDSFYGPFLMMLKADHELAQELRSRQGDENYRMLTYLFNEEWRRNLSLGDAAIVKEVCNYANALDILIKEKSGMADSKIRPYLSRASNHFRMLHLAHENKLGGDSTNFARYVYPRQLDEVLEIEINRLHDRCEKIKSSPTTPPGPLPPLVIPDRLNLPEWPNPERGGPR